MVAGSSTATIPVYRPWCGRNRLQRKKQRYAMIASDHKNGCR